MPKQQQQSKKKGRNVGKNLRKCASYRQRRRREYNKLSRILQSNGEKCAKQWARDNHCLDIYVKLTAAA